MYVNYIFVRSGTQWSQEAYLKSANGHPARFGSSVSLTDDGYLFSAAPGDESLQATIINGTGANTDTGEVE